VKRVIDVVVALAVIGLFGWCLALVWVVVRLQSNGPGIFAQERVGLHGKLFTCYKFRTMYLNTANRGTHEISASAITPLGRLLRSTKIDELPQVWNILRNELSLVGPRPCLPSQSRLVQLRTENGVLSVLPGMTGLAQINQVDMSDPEKLVTWDRMYVEQRSTALDLKIVLSTVLGQGGGDKVVKP
jgi:lipopolysaccharide/colanic/teichoic acid biosynthesis glycosyltransferase